METSLTWLDNILSNLGDSSYDLKILRVRKLLDTKTDVEHQQEEYGGDDDTAFLEEGGGCNLQNPQYIRSFAMLLNKATLKAFTGDLEGAFEHLGKVQKELEELEGEHKGRLMEVITYFVEALEWSISGTENADVANILRDKWDKLQDDLKYKAVILYLKANLARLFPGEDKLLETLLEIIKLDPDYHIWSLYAYQALRYQRRIFSKTKKIFKAPSKQEIDFCENAYRLAPNILTTFNLATMFKDCVSMTFYKSSLKDLQFDGCPMDTNEAMEKCLKLFDDAIAMAAENDLNDWGLKCKVQKADLLCHQGTDKQRRIQGLNLFLELIECHPDNAYYHQKLARLYQFGVRGDAGKIYLRNLNKAHFHFKLALELHQRNYGSSVRDYIRLFNFLDSPYPVQEALELVTEALTTYANLLAPKDLANLRIWRGCLLWVHNPKKYEDNSNKWTACLDWLYVLKNYPEHRDSVLKNIWNPPVHVYLKKNKKLRHVPGKICSNELKKQLEKIKKEEDGGIGISTDIILEEIERNPGNISGLTEAVNLEDGQEEHLETIHDDNVKKTKSKSSKVPKKACKWKGLADKDDNWRLR